MSTKLKTGVIVLLLLNFVALLYFQQRHVQSLSTENADLRSQLEQISALQETNAQLVAQLKAATEHSLANQTELIRLRSQGTKTQQLEKENARLKAQHQETERLLRQAQTAVATPPAVAASETNAPSPRPDVAATDLGIVELSAGIALRYDLGGGTNCVVVPINLADGNATIQLSIEVPSPDGTALELGTSKITAPLGQQSQITVADRLIQVATKLK